VLDAGLRGQELAVCCGWHESKTSRILNARKESSEGGIRAWCRAFGADRMADLIAIARAVASMYVEWRRLHRAGLTRTQEQNLDRYDPEEFVWGRTLASSSPPPPPSRAAPTAPGSLRWITTPVWGAAPLWEGAGAA
jgi:hypothetical protein